MKYCKKHKIPLTHMLLENKMSKEIRIDEFCIICKREKLKTQRDKDIMTRFFVERDE